MSERSELLWHYTNAAGVKGIVEDQCVFATDADYLNDSSELSYAWDVADQVLRDLAVEQFDRAKVFDEARRFGNLVTGMDSINVFCVCADPDVLSQWRAYTTGTGFAIGFDAGAIASGLAHSSAPLVFGHPRYGLQPVIYDRRLQVARLRAEAIAGVENQVVRGWQDEESLRAAAASVRLCLRLASPFVKHPAFRVEAEWRVFEARFGPEDHEFVVRPSGLVPFVRLKMWIHTPDGWTTTALPIKKVIVGPGLHQQEARKAAELLLWKAGYPDPEIVSCSSTPWRD